ncbi:MAG: class I SAM-dependent methyltransferase [Bilifractor sp.]
MSNIKWNADDYADHFSFVAEYGHSLIEMIDVREGMTCLDLGCGNGSLTAKLKESGLEVTGLDDSMDQIRKAKQDYPDIRFIQGNACDFFLEEPVDLVFSNAVFHWIDKDRQRDMLRCVYQALKSGGQFVFEFGGKGNNALIHGSLRRAFSRRNLEYKFPFYFPTIGEYTSLMESEGFDVRTALLFDRKTKLRGSDGLHDWIRMFVKKPFEEISELETEQILNEVVEELRPRLFQNGSWYADYVRLRCRALK